MRIAPAVFLFSLLALTASSSHATPESTCAVYAVSSMRIPLDRSDAVRLCRGTRSETAPVTCAGHAYNNLDFSKDRSVDLCSGTSSETAPVTCYRYAIVSFRITVDSEQALRLCAGTDSESGPIDCASSATSPYGAQLGIEDAITLCSRPRGDR